MAVTDRIRRGTTATVASRPTSRPAGLGSAANEDVRPVSRRRQLGHFLRHYGEMCAPMCIGFAVGDLLYFWVARRFGYSDPFSELPELSVLVITFTMTTPMVGWMLFRGMPRRETAEMAAVMPVLAIALLALGWLELVAKSNLALLEHGLMMPAMLVPMFLRLDLYTGRASSSSSLKRCGLATASAISGMTPSRQRRTSYRNSRKQEAARVPTAPSATTPRSMLSRHAGACSITKRASGTRTSSAE